MKQCSLNLIDCIYDFFVIRYSWMLSSLFNKNLFLATLRMFVYVLSRIFAGLELILSHVLKTCIASYYKQFRTNIKIKIIKLKPVLLSWSLGQSGLKPRFNLFNIYFHFHICGKLSYNDTTYLMISVLLSANIFNPFFLLK